MTPTAPNTTDSSRKVFLIGATGGVGRRLIAALTTRGHRVTGVHHSQNTADTVHHAGAVPLQADIAADTAAQFAKHMAGHDAVIFCAGAGGGGEQVDAIDGRGPGKAADAAAQARVKRFVLVSVFMDAWRGEKSPGADFERYMSAKRIADVALAATDLDWLIVRPGTLSDDAGTGKITAGIAVAYRDIPRDDVATFITTALFTPNLNRIAVEITGGDTPVEAAVTALTPFR